MNKTGTKTIARSSNKKNKISSLPLNKPSSSNSYEETFLMKDALISSIGDGVIIVNAYGTITDINDRALFMLGYPRKKLIGSWLPGAIPLKDMKGNNIASGDRTVSKAITQGVAVTETVSYVKYDGTLLPVSATASPLIMNGKPIGAVIVFRDFSHEILVDKAKDEFVSFASHQLRTPLTAVKMYAEILKSPNSGKLNKEQTLYLGRIETATNKMIDLVSDFLNISKLELGKFEIKPEIVDLTAVVKTHIDDIQAIAKGKGVLITYKHPRSMLTVNVDLKLINQVIHNLLTNALRYTMPRKGKIEVKISKKRNCVEVSVSDNGIGIPEDAKGRIFQRFFRADNAATHQPDGTGLGLYLARQIAEASDGSLKFESQLGRGTTFILSLPLINKINS